MVAGHGGDLSLPLVPPPSSALPSAPEVRETALPANSLVHAPLDEGVVGLVIHDDDHPLWYACLKSWRGLERRGRSPRGGRTQYSRKEIRATLVEAIFVLDYQRPPPRGRPRPCIAALSGRARGPARPSAGPPTGSSRPGPVARSNGSSLTGVNDGNIGAANRASEHAPGFSERAAKAETGMPNGTGVGAAMTIFSQRGNEDVFFFFSISILKTTSSLVGVKLIFKFILHLAGTSWRASPTYQKPWSTAIS